MRSIRHPLSGALYDLQTDGTVRVEKDGKSGTFRADGSYVSGDIYSADPQMCVWVGGRELSSRVRPRSGPLIPAKST
jgi:non-ribosomal peptide synthetase component E (peptide arylation enzyme)